jgi:hypothetical protein
MQEISPLIIKGKNINALLGASSLGVEVRKASTNMQIPYRMAIVENQKNGFVSKMRYQKIQESYLEFVNSICSEVFGTSSTLPENLSEEDEND